MAKGMKTMSGSVKQPTLRQVTLIHDNQATLYMMCKVAERLGGVVIRKTTRVPCQIDEEGYNSLVRQFGVQHVRLERDVSAFTWQAFYAMHVPYEYEGNAALCDAEMKIGDRTIKGRIKITFNEKGLAESYVFNPN